MLDSGSCLTPIYIYQDVRQFSTLPESTMALFTALTIFGLKRDNSKQRLKVTTVTIIGGTVYCSSNALLEMRRFSTFV